jgi:hypothetical protein
MRKGSRQERKTRRKRKEIKTKRAQNGGGR